MKRFLFLVLLLPAVSFGQSYRVFSLEEKGIEPYTNDSVMRSWWHVLSRGTIGDQLNMFFRFSVVNSQYFLELKVMNAGRSIVIARGERLALMLDDGNKIELYNSDYQHSCRGCGARGYGGSDAEGITLSYPIKKADISRLQYHYVDRVRLYSADGYWQKRVTDYNSDVFINQVHLILNSGIR